MALEVSRPLGGGLVDAVGHLPVIAVAIAFPLVGVVVTTRFREPRQVTPLPPSVATE